jgi:hypothetical protein
MLEKCILHLILYILIYKLNQVYRYAFKLLQSYFNISQFCWVKL